MNFRVGQKVVCVNSSRAHTYPLAKRELEKGRVYTIAALTEREGEPCVFLAEILDRPVYNLYGEIISWTSDFPFSAARFRPIVERKTDISVFTEILRKATKPAPATPVALHQGK